MWQHKTSVPKNTPLVHTSAGWQDALWQAEFLPCPILCSFPLSSLTEKKNNFCLQNKPLIILDIWKILQRVKFDETILEFDFHPQKFFTNNTLKPRPVWHRAQGRNKDGVPNFGELWLCRGKKDFAHTPIPALPLSAGSSLITISPPAAASGLSGDGQVTGAVQTQAGRQLQGSSSGKKI